jgi:hypothetical protein
MGYVYLLQLHDGLLLGLLFDPEGGYDMFLRNVGRISNYLHNIIYQNVLELFITTAVRISNPTHITLYRFLALNEF